MLFTYYLKRIAILGVILFAVMSCDDDDDFLVPRTNTVADFVEITPRFSNLNAALETTGLKSVLATDPNLTVFAPDNDAFNEFLSDQGFTGLNAVPQDVLRQLLLNHVVDGTFFAADLTTGYVETRSTATPNEDNLNLFVDTSSGVELNGSSTVVAPDLVVDNGVVHEVDEVIEMADITVFATADPDFETLVTALTSVGAVDFIDILQSQGQPAPFTVFGPTNQAFTDLLNELGASSLDDIPEDVVSRVLQYHVITEINATSNDLTDGMTITTFEGGEVIVNIDAGTVRITDERGRISTVVRADIQATNGVIHKINTVLLPEDESSSEQ